VRLLPGGDSQREYRASTQQGQSITACITFVYAFCSKETTFPGSGSCLGLPHVRSLRSGHIMLCLAALYIGGGTLEGRLVVKHFACQPKRHPIPLNTQYGDSTPTPLSAAAMFLTNMLTALVVEHYQTARSEAGAVWLDGDLR
jgi:hypothetical protein